MNYRSALRYLARNPFFAAFAAIGIALAIATSTTMFAIASAVFLKHSSLVHPEQLALIMAERVTKDAGVQPDLLNATDLGAIPAAYQKNVAWYEQAGARVETQGTTIVASHAAVSRNYFDILQASPSRGRGFATDDERSQSCPVVISEAFARRLAADDAIGRGIRLDGVDCTVIGVMGAQGAYPDHTDIWSLGAPPTATDASLVGVTRLRSPSDVAAFKPLRLTLLTNASNNSIKASSFAGVTIAVIITVLIALLNVGTFYATRSHSRSREHAVRLALGASTARVAGQAAIEVLAIVAMSLPFAYFIARGALSVAIASLPDLDLKNVSVMDARVLIFAIATALMAVAVVAAAPLLTVMRRSTADLLRDAASGLTASRQTTVRRRILIAFQLGMIVLLLTLGVTCITYVRRMSALDVGMDASKIDVVTMQLDVAGITPGDVDIDPLLAIARQRAGKSLLEPVAAWAVRSAPWNQPNGDARSTDGSLPTAPHSQLWRYMEVTPDFFRVIGAHLVAGRTLNAGDRDGSLPVVVITKPMADRWWPHSSAVGRQITFGSRSSLTAFTVVGVVDNMQEPDELGRNFVSTNPNADFPLAFIPWSQRTLSTMYVRQCLGCTSIHIGFRDATPRTTQLVHNALAAAMPRASLTSGTLRDLQMSSRSFSGEVASARVLSAFAVICIVLAMIGVWALGEETVRQRRRELGIRAALGASRMQVLVAAISGNIAYGAAGVVLGTCIALLWIPRLTRLTGVHTASGRLHPSAIVAMAVALVLVNIAASITSARGSLRISPRVALEDRTH